MQGEFARVFKNVKLSNGLSQAFSHAFVKSLAVDREEKRMRLDIKLPEIIDESRIDELNSILREQFPFLSSVDIQHSYELIGASVESTVKQYRENCIRAVGKQSPACAALLEYADWDASDGALRIGFQNNGSFIFRARKMDKFLVGLINSRLGLRLGLELADGKSIESKKTEIFAYEPPLPKPVSSPVPVSHPTENFTASRPETPSYKNPDGSYKKRRKATKMVKELKGVETPLESELQADEKILVEGLIFRIDERTTKSGLILFVFDITDFTGSVTVKFFLKPEKLTDDFRALLKPGKAVRIFGNTSFDDYSKEIVIMALEITSGSLTKKTRADNCGEKRVELHLHTKMSQTDAVTSATDYIRRARDWGHKAVAITDHGVLQAYPEAMAAAKETGVKVIYGVEAYIVDDVCPVAILPRKHTLDGDFVVFDIETTGLVKEAEEIIEIGAVKIRKGVIVERFAEFVKPGRLISEETTGLTGITNEMLIGAKRIEAVLSDFLDFIGDGVLVAHNAQFDVGFISHYAIKIGRHVNNSYLCTVELSRAMFPKLNKHKLDYLCEQMGIELKNHHRAVDDAVACAEMFLKFRETLLEAGALSLTEVNTYAASHMEIKKKHSNHAIILVKNLTGLRNLYELVTNAHLNHFYHSPKIPKSEFSRLRDGLIIGTACEAGELFQALYRKESDERIAEIVGFYDYLEIQPSANNMFMIRNKSANDIEELRDYYREIVRLGELFGKPVTAACDAHFMDEEDEILRHILSAPKNTSGYEAPLPLYYRTTQEMLDEFAYLGKEKAYETVVTNTSAIAEMCDVIKPIPDGTFPPKIEGSEEMLKELAYSRAKSQYGDPLPDIVAARLERELGSIIKNGFAVMYIIAEKLVKKSMEDGYLVGSRGSVGSSFVATMASITEVNPFPPHYFCAACKYTDFESLEVRAFAGGSGCDMPEKSCPVCGAPLSADGHDIPFETFLGFNGEKEPDIDLNFSGEYQARAHAFTEQLFGKGYVYKAGTIGTLAEKTALGYVKKYYENKGLVQRNAEVNRLTQALTGIKKTTGQHPGGLVVVPEGRSIYEFCPVQRPADDSSSDIVTTHFDYHSISGRLLKLDILGHDVPTIIRMLQDFTGIDPTKINLGDKEVISLFTSPKALGLREDQISCNTGTLGLPEFGTPFVRQMLMDTKPSSFAELVRISGLSHGTNVWLGNAQELIRKGIATLGEVIPTRDDIMVYLMNKGMEKGKAFAIMENVRKGKGVKQEEAELMRASGVPEWYIESCNKISYMFPKGHAVAYVMMTVRIGWYKIHYPAAFYASAFSVKAQDFDYMTMCRGKDIAKSELHRLNELTEKSAKDEGSVSILELVIEMYERGLDFLPLDLYKSDAKKFLIEGDMLLPPLCTVAGLGENAALGIVNSRADGEYISIDDFKKRTKITKTVISMLKENNILSGLSETNQLSFF